MKKEKRMFPKANKSRMNELNIRKEKGNFHVFNENVIKKNERRKEQKYWVNRVKKKKKKEQGI